MSDIITIQTQVCESVAIAADCQRLALGELTRGDCRSFEPLADVVAEYVAVVLETLAADIERLTAAAVIPTA